MLSQLYLHAVLPCLTDLADQDPSVSRTLAGISGSIELRILGGDGATLRFKRGRIEYLKDASSMPSVILLFFTRRHLNAFFSGQKTALPFPIWGGWRLKLIARFSKVADTLEAVLNGEPEVLATHAGRRLHTRLSLIAAGLGLAPLAAGDASARQALRSTPKGLAAFSIAGESNATVWFDHGPQPARAGWSEPPRRPDVRIEFKNLDVAYAAMRDELDSMAAVGSGAIRIEGLIPLADGLNFVMERMRAYLQP